jgi:hypothetical protein
MNVTTNYKFKLYKKGEEYSDNLLPKEVLKRWKENNLISFKSKPKNKKNDNESV